MQSRIKLSRAAAITTLVVALAPPQISVAAAPVSSPRSTASSTLVSSRVAQQARPAPTRRPSSSAVASFRTSRHLGEDLVRIQLRVSRALSLPPLGSTEQLPPDALRMRILVAAGLDSPAALRSTAAGLRSRETSDSRSSLALARRAVEALYPYAPELVSAAEVAFVLDAAAADHDRRTLEISVAESEDKPVLLSALRLGQMVPAGASASRAVSLLGLLADGVELHRRYEAALSESARFVLAAAGTHGRSSVSELAATWVASGYRRANAVLTALAQVGKTYRFANRGPDAFDCSGLTAYAWAHSGLYIPNSSFSQRAATANIGSSQKRALPGDLVFYRVRMGRSGAPSGHVAMWLGFGSLIVEAQQNADQVHVTQISSSLFASFGQIRLAGERADGLLLPRSETHGPPR